MREKQYDFERHNIELSDQEHLKRIRFMLGKEDENTVEMVYSPPIESELPPELKEKFDLAKKLCNDTQTIDLRKKNAKTSSKISTKSTKKNNSKSLQTAMENVQD